MSQTYTIPSFPSDWIKHSPITIEPGHLPYCIIIHHNDPDSYHPFVVHMAVARDGHWSYCNGDYCFTVEEAEILFDKRK